MTYRVLPLRTEILPQSDTSESLMGSQENCDVVIQFSSICLLIVCVHHIDRLTDWLTDSV